MEAAEPTEADKDKKAWREFWALSGQVATEIETRTNSVAGDPFGGWPLDDIRRLEELATALGRPAPVIVCRNPNYLYFQWPQGGRQSVLTFVERCDDPVCEVCEHRGACRPVPISAEQVRRVADVLRSWQREAGRVLGADMPATDVPFLAPGEAMRLVPLENHTDPERRRIFRKLLRAVEPDKQRQIKQGKKTMHFVSLEAWRELVANLMAESDDSLDVAEAVDRVVEFRRRRLGL